MGPTNEGFDKLPSSTEDTLLKPENKAQLVDILTYHVLPEKVETKQLKFFQRVNTVEGKPVHIYKTAAYGVRVTLMARPSRRSQSPIMRRQTAWCTSLMEFS